MLGARGAGGCTPEEAQAYQRVHAFNDRDGNGKLSRQEYVEEGRYMMTEARAGIFWAMDRDRDGIVTEREYVENRIITDEAKEIFHNLDQNADGSVTKQEFVERSAIRDTTEAASAFNRFDTNGDGATHMIEFLRAWGDIARDGGNWATVELKPLEERSR